MRVPQSQETAGGKYWHPNTSFEEGSWKLGHSKYPFPFASEKKGIILISMNENGVRSRDSH